MQQPASIPSLAPAAGGRAEEVVLQARVASPLGALLPFFLTASKMPPTMLGAQQAVEDLFHHNGVEFDELWQGLNHFFLQAEGREAGQVVPSIPNAGPGEVRRYSGLTTPTDTPLLSLPLLPRG